MKSCTECLDVENAQRTAMALFEILGYCQALFILGEHRWRLASMEVFPQEEVQGWTKLSSSRLRDTKKAVR